MRVTEPSWRYLVTVATVRKVPTTQFLGAVY